MKRLAPRFRTEFSILTLVGSLIEIILVLIVILLYTTPWYLVGASFFIMFGLVRASLLLLACIFERCPWLIASVECLGDGKMLDLRSPNIVFRTLGFTRNTSFVRALCYTRDFRGFYGVWCLFSKLYQHILFIITIIIVLFFYILIPSAHNSNTIRRLVIIDILYLVFTVYFDHFLVWRILVLRRSATNHRNDPDELALREIFKEPTFDEIAFTYNLNQINYKK